MNEDSSVQPIPTANSPVRATNPEERGGEPHAQGQHDQ